MVNSEYLSYSKLNLHFTITYDLIIPSQKYADLRRVRTFVDMQLGEAVQNNKKLSK